VVVDEFDIFCASFSPDETDPPLRVHPDAVLTTTVSSQSLQAVPRWDPQVHDIICRVDQLKLPQGCPLHDLINAFDVLLMPNALGVLATERSDNAISI